MRPGGETQQLARLATAYYALLCLRRVGWFGLGGQQESASLTETECWIGQLVLHFLGATEENPHEVSLSCSPVQCLFDWFKIFK